MCRIFDTHTLTIRTYSRTYLCNFSTLLFLEVNQSLDVLAWQLPFLRHGKLRNRGFRPGEQAD